MTKVVLKFNEEHHTTEEEFLRDIANRSRYKYALFEITHNLWRRWKHDESNLNIDTFKSAIGEILDECGINYNDLE